MIVTDSQPIGSKWLYYVRMRRTSRIFASLIVLLIIASRADACSLALKVYQVTSLKGVVVGKSLGPLQFHWLQRRFSVSGAQLEVFEDSGPTLSHQKPLAQTVSDKAGEFAFGPLKDGRYAFHVKGSGMDDWFVVEIANKPPATKRIMVDISPIHPDCSGGHAILIQAETK